MPEQSKFEINRMNKENVECLYLTGYLDAHTAPDLENAINDVIESGNKNILVNFRELDYISSAGLGVFMSFIEELRESGGDIKMSDMTKKVFSVFDLLGFPMLFDIEKEEQNAIKKFNNAKEEDAK